VAEFLREAQHSGLENHLEVALVHHVVVVQASLVAVQEFLIDFYDVYHRGHRRCLCLLWKNVCDDA